MESEVTKRNDQENTNDYSDVSYEDLYNSYTQGQNMNSYTVSNNNYNNQNQNYNYSDNNYLGNDYDQSYRYNQNGQMQNKNYYEDNEDLASLDRYFNDDNYIFVWDFYYK